MYFQVKICFKGIKATVLEAKSDQNSVITLAESALKHLPGATAEINKKRSALKDWEHWLDLSQTSPTLRQYKSKHI